VKLSDIRHAFKVENGIPIFRDVKLFNDHLKKLEGKNLRS
jgi:hypothetical protein